MKTLTIFIYYIPISPSDRKSIHVLYLYVVKAKNNVTNIK
jgi:hypothetical protein